MKAIIRINEKKFKDAGEITTAVEHNLRFGKQAENVNPEKSKNNVTLLDVFEISGKPAGYFQKELMKSFKEKEIVIKSNNVLCLEWIATASPEFFVGKSKKEVLDWAKDQVNYFKKEFGDAVKHMVLHLDESTPHIHILISPEEKKIYKSVYKNKLGEKITQEKLKYGLNAKRFDVERLIKIQDSYAEFNKKYGLDRGVKGSTTEHKTLKELREEDKKLLEEVLNLPDNYLDLLKKEEKNGKKIDWAKTVAQAFKTIDYLKKRLYKILNIKNAEIKIKELEEKKIKLEEKNKELNKNIKVIERQSLENSDLKSENDKLKKENLQYKFKELNDKKEKDKELDKFRHSQAVKNLKSGPKID